MRLIKIFVRLLLVSFSLNSFGEFKAEPTDIVGFWLSENKKGVVEIYPKGDAFEGKIVWVKDIYEGKADVKFDIHNPDKSKRKQPLIGLVNLKNFKFDGREWSGGTIYDPQKGKTYKAFMRLSKKDTMKLRGFIGISLFGRTEVWSRQKSATPDSYEKN
ncbi:MAG: SIGNAL peptide protein [Halobacteriovoraceae bacterium]|nr:SIGNAL peptide protein [Halobacteriovoraceae bacterium]|tara:strand:+ start:6506 stop:6982 length:477 start_codon:yes stop_codon:yes gene_type:complete